jgi:hypothetical protein
MQLNDVLLPPRLEELLHQLVGHLQGRQQQRTWTRNDVDSESTQNSAELMSACYYLVLVVGYAFVKGAPRPAVQQIDTMLPGCTPAPVAAPVAATADALHVLLQPQQHSNAQPITASTVHSHRAANSRQHAYFHLQHAAPFATQATYSSSASSRSPVCSTGADDPPLLSLHPCTHLLTAAVLPAWPYILCYTWAAP